MANSQPKSQLSSDDLLRAAEQLSDSAFECFVLEVNALSARRKARQSQAEADLLRKIDRTVPSALQMRYDELIARWQAELLTEQEYAELVQLTRQMEKLEAERLAHLASLARLRGVSLPALMASLGISDRVSG